MKKIQLMAMSIFCGLACFAQNPQDLYPVKQNGKWGYINKTGTVVIQPVFDYAHADLYKTLNIVKDAEGYFLADNTGKPLFKERYAEFSDNCESGVLGFRDQQGNWGCMDTTGKILIPFELQNIIHFLDGINVAYRDDGTSGYYDITGKFTAIPGFTILRNLNEGFIMVANKVTNDRQAAGIYDTRSNKIVVKDMYNRVEEVKNGHTIVTDTLGQNGIINIRTGRYTLVPRKGQNIYTSTYNPYLIKALAKPNDFYSVYYNGKTTITDCTGKKMFDLKKTYQQFMVLGFYNGYATIMKSKMHGIVDMEGNIVIEPVYEKLSLVSNEGIIAVSKNGVCGYMDVSGNIIVPLTYSDAANFMNGLGAVYTGGLQHDIYSENENHCKLGYVDVKGKVIWSPAN